MTEICDLEPVKALASFAAWLVENPHRADVVQFDDDSNPLIPRAVAREFREWLSNGEPNDCD